MKKISAILALVLVLAMVFSLTACAKTTIVGTWKYNMDLGKALLAEAESQTGETQDAEKAAAQKAMIDGMKKIYDGISMTIILDLKEDKTFTMKMDEEAMKAVAEKFKEQAKAAAPDMLKAMFGEDTLNALLEAQGKTLEEYAAEYAEEMSLDDADFNEVKGTYTFEEGKLVLTPDDKDEKPVTMVAELSAKELKVTSIEGDDEAVESFKSVLPMVFSK